MNARTLRRAVPDDVAVLFDNHNPTAETEIEMDEDLQQMSRSELIDEVKKLRRGIRQHRDSTLHELCWHHPALWGLLPEQTDPLPEVPEWPEFLRGCIHYRQSLDQQLPNAPRTSRPYTGRDRSRVEGD